MVQNPGTERGEAERMKKSKKIFFSRSQPEGIHRKNFIQYHLQNRKIFFDVNRDGTDDKNFFITARRGDVQVYKMYNYRLIPFLLPYITIIGG